MRSCSCACACVELYKLEELKEKKKSLYPPLLGERHIGSNVTSSLFFFPRVREAALVVSMKPLMLLLCVRRDLDIIVHISLDREEGI